MKRNPPAGWWRASRPLSRGNRRFLFHSSERLAERKHFLLLAAEPAQRDGAHLRLALADDEQERDLLQAVLADLVVDLLVGDVELDPKAERGRRKLHLGGIGI